ncbi:Type IV secretion-system coupling protein DNA-binding domain-containing protein [Dyadobacter sp. SG02]|uniref:YWFCY domain-containing protein n=1 Tax=Dyadobacter sp. SG02 TaxID=1855291 RepID=UPI0008B515EF|nr:YWFCY domain-containing protein [Dyadobacter sp. SG02]SEJ74713.1 Type IV secretion-system coupling protein DNA-binding domain-containing protein [Dyadobacter sp. SG02]
MTSNSEKEGRVKGVDTLFILTLLMVLLHHFWFNFHLFDFVPSLGRFDPQLMISKVLLRIQDKHGIFSSPIYTKVIVFFLLILYSIGSRGRIDPNIKVKDVYMWGLLGLVGFFGSIGVLYITFLPSVAISLIYIFVSNLSILWLVKAGQQASRIMYFRNTNDIFNTENETFPQNEQYKKNEYSVHFKTKYYYQKKWRTGWVNVINPFRANMVLGTPGSGKSFAVLNPAIWQSLWKGYTAYVYDFKYPTLTLEAYNAYLKTINQNPGAWGKDKNGKNIIPKFFVINFDDLEFSHRCNPLLPETITDTIDAFENATTIMLNLNREWVKKQGDFFVESAINFLASCIWFMKLVSEKYNDLLEAEQRSANPDRNKISTYRRFAGVCTFPHVIEFACQEDIDTMFKIMAKYESLEVFIRPFASAAKAGAADQLEGQLASVRIPIAKLSSEIIYWVMSGNDFSLDINNPRDPKILCTGNNPERAKIYAAVFSLYTSRMIKIINKQEKLKSALFWDELPTMFVKGIDQLIATARSNKVATWLGFQDFEQLTRDYGQDEARVISNTVGNVFSGQLVFESAEKLSKRFGKTQQENENISFGREDTTVSLSTSLHDSIPASKISTLKQGEFVGQFSDNFGEEFDLKSFKSFFVVDQEGMKKQVKTPPAIVNISKLVSKMYPSSLYNDSEKEQWKKRILRDNYKRIKRDVIDLIQFEHEHGNLPAQ